MRTEKLANEIIKLFIDNQIPINIQLDALKLAKLKIEFCKEAGKDMKQNSLEFNPRP